MNWVYNDSSLFYYGGSQSVEDYNKKVTDRRNKFNFLSNKYVETIQELNNNGFTIIKNAISMNQINSLNIEFDECIKNNKVSVNNDYFTMVSNPLLNSKTSFDIATSDMLYDIAGEFFNCVPSLCTQNFRLSKLNNKQSNSTQIFHCDRNNYVKFVKFFIYMNDVDLQGGPLTYVKGSNKKKPFNHLNSYRWEEDTIQQIYGEEAICYLTASAGDLLIANTTGFHRGTKPTNKERRMLTLNYVIDNETDVSKPFQANKEWANAISEKKKPLFDFMELV